MFWCAPHGSRGAGDDVSRAMEDAIAFRKTIIWFISISTSIVLWISLIRLTYAVTEGSMTSTARVIFLVPLAWVIVGVLWCAVLLILFAVCANLG